MCFEPKCLPICQCRRLKRCKFKPWVRKIPRRGAWQPTPVFLPENAMDRRTRQATVHRVAESQTQLKRLSMHACIGEGNGNPLQYSCLENPKDRGAWWVAVYGVSQSQTRLKRLSSSSSSNMMMNDPIKIFLQVISCNTF